MNTTASPNTPDLPMPATKRANGRSFADFGELLHAEKNLLASCALGEVAWIGDVVPTDGSDPNKLIRASFLRFLLLGGDEQAPVHEKGVQLCGAWIKDQLSIENCLVVHGMNLFKCKFDEPIIARDAHFAGLLNLSGSHLLQGLDADRLRCDSDVFLGEGFRSFSEVRLLGAHIGGNLQCSGGQFEPKLGNALSADRAVVKGSVFFDKQFKATGEVRLLGTNIGGHLACRGGQFFPQKGHALSADHAVVKGGVFMDKEFKATGEVRLLGAQIGGTLSCSGGQFDPNEGDAIAADGAIVKGDVYLNEQFKATGTVRLASSQIGGTLACSGGKFDPKEGDAIDADGAAVKGNVFLNEKFKATGSVRLLGAHIGGSLVCSGGQFEPKKLYALSFDRTVVKGNVLLNKQFKATGTVRLHSAEIGGIFECSGGKFEPQKGHALSVDLTVIKGSVLLGTEFKASGTVRLAGAQIGGDLTCSGGQFSANIKDVLHLQTTTVQNGLILRALKGPVNINVASAQIGVLVDEPTAWAKGSILNGLVYRSLTGTAPTDAASRIAWLKQQSDKDLGEDDAKQGFRPQPWKQLQKVLREMGHEADAREVGIAFENQLRKADRIGQITNASKAKDIIPVARRQCLRGLHWLFGVLAGYGYRPMRLLMSLIMVWLFCALVYWWLALPPYNALGPTDPLVFQNPDYAACSTECKGNWMLCDKLPAEYTTFSPLAYSLDILLPLVDLGQEKTWGALVPTPKLDFFNELFALSPAHWVRLLNWFEILFGWVASLLFVAIVSGMSRRSETDK